MQVIGFAGLARAGKSTSAQFLAREAFDLGLTPHHERFAGPLKDASDMLGFRKGGDTDALYREFCQWAGQRARAESTNWWCDRMDERLNRISAKEQETLKANIFHEPVVIIDDVRYLNEINLVRKWQGRLVFVCGMKRFTEAEMAEPWRQHESEQLALDYTHGRLPDDTFDFTMSNGGTIDQLQMQIKSMAPHWLGLTSGGIL